MSLLPQALYNGRILAMLSYGRHTTSQEDETRLGRSRNKSVIG